MDTLNDTERFCQMVRARSQENAKAVFLLSHNGLTGQVISVLRQELDSMVRVIYLLSLDLSDRDGLINLTIAGQKWKLKGRGIVTDKQMVDLADTLNGWTKSVYKFGCSFIHLSSFHDYSLNDPFSYLEAVEVLSIVTHLNHYHGFPMTEKLTVQALRPYLPMVFDKIAGNLECYVKQLEERETDLI